MKGNARCVRHCFPSTSETSSSEASKKRPLSRKPPERQPKLRKATTMTTMTMRTRVRDKAKDNDGLVSALQKERKAAKEAQRALRAAQKRLDELDAKDKSDTDKAKDTASKAESQVQKLAGKLLKAEVDNSITKLAGELKFRDIDDALKLVDRSLIEVEQDDDDPSDIDLDLESVKSALAKLAKSKPHLIMAEGQGDKSGSKFNGSKKPTKDAEDEAIRSKYPALRRSSHTA
jgi:hypothetical protein